MQEYVQIVRELFSDPDGVTIQFHRIESFHKLLLDELPYGPINQSELVQGQVEFDGPAAYPSDLRRPLQWYFGGTAFEICKAMRIQYRYERTLPGLDYPAPVNGSLFLGYVSNPLDSNHYRAAYDHERGIELKGVPNDIATLLAALRDVRDEYVRYPTRTIPDAVYVPTRMFDEFVLENFPWQSLATIAKLREDAQAAAEKNCCDAPQPTPLARMFDRGPVSDLPGARIQYDGPARTFDRSNVFPYTIGTLFNEQSGLYGKLLWWYFGGRPYQMTKAMLLHYDDSPIHTDDGLEPVYKGGPRDPDGAHRGYLMVGYQGPSGYP